MKTIIVPGMAAAAALAISACGGASGGGASGSVSNAAAPTTRTATISVHQLSGVGRVLVDSSGKPIYTPAQEAGGRILCGSGCTTFWKPVTAAGKPTAAPSAGKLGVIKRPDGSMQVTDNGRPLYTFAEDSAGKATGDGFKDAFSGHHFTWHVVRAGGTTTRSGASTAPAYTTPSSGGNGY
jgi:predicted lipoprotein with Yx(FWY)xxD motif